MSKPFTFYAGAGCVWVPDSRDETLIAIAQHLGWRLGLTITYARGFQLQFYRGTVGDIVRVTVGRQRLARWVGAQVSKL